MFRSVLIANRGEIACRVARTAKRLGMRTIAVYSEADATALHVRACDEAHLIGPPPARESYLSADKIIAVAKAANAECIHPGYGFLSENAEFAEQCAAAGVVFVGPPPSAIRAMGLKDRAKALMEKAGVPVVPGYHGERQDAAFLRQKAYEIGYPVLIKAVAGGGGKGMRRVDKHADFDAALEAAMRESQSAFGDGRVLIEKFIASPRHVEIQVFGDRQGNVVHLNERDCSLQRRHQKVMEESPAPGMTPAVRKRMGEAAIAAAAAVGYVGAGTVEFIADGSRSLRPDGFWFMEMNTRLQVEHPVTEAITGFDLVEWQFRVAGGDRLPRLQSDIGLNGHAVEARLYAEDVERGFLPSTGKLVALRFPSRDGVRIDTGVEEGGEVTAFYDPMIAKVIAHAPTRDAALDALADALDATIAIGPRTNLGFLSAVCRTRDFRAGQIDTGFIERHLDTLVVPRRAFDSAAAAAGVVHLLAKKNTRAASQDEAAPRSPWDATDAFQLGGERSVLVPVLVDGRPAQAHIGYRNGMQVTVGDAAADPAAAVIESQGRVYVLRRGRQTVVQLAEGEALGRETHDGDGVIRAPMHGKVLAVLVEKGAQVEKGHRLALIEAMKMEHALTAPLDGLVAEIAVEAGQQVAEGAKIMTIAAAATEAVDKAQE